MANNNLIIHRAPKNIELNCITSFIRVFNFIFDLAGKGKPHYHLSFLNVNRCDVTGVLLLYKLLEYSVSKQCFSSPTHDIAYNDFLKECIADYGFSDLIKSLMNNPNEIDLRHYKKLKVSSDNKVLIAPIALIREDTSHSLEIIKNQYVPLISSFYQEDKVRQMVLGVFTEIVHNFWAHATTDSKSIVVGYGTHDHFEIVCCDNGLGIDGTMRRCFPIKDSKTLVKKAMENGVTSKTNSSHMGYGLWFINEVITRTQGSFTVVSNDVQYQNNHGKINVMNCPYWKGSIVSVKLPLEHPITISDMGIYTNTTLKINFI